MRLLVIRNPHSPLLAHIDLGRQDQKIILIQNGVYAESLREKNALVLECDARARNIDAGENAVNYDRMLDAVMEAGRVICI